MSVLTKSNVEVNLGPGSVQDGDFSEKRFRDIVNAALANDIGNLLNRSLNLLKKNCGGAMPADSSQLPDSSPVRQIAQQQVRICGRKLLLTEHLLTTKACFRGVTGSGDAIGAMTQTAVDQLM